MLGDTCSACRVLADLLSTVRPEMAVALRSSMSDVSAPGRLRHMAIFGAAVDFANRTFVREPFYLTVDANGRMSVYDGSAKLDDAEVVG